MTERATDVPASSQRRPAGPSAISVAAILLALTAIAALGFMAWVVLKVEDDQIPLLVGGMIVLGASFALAALLGLRGLWRAAARARGGRALALAIFGGLAGLAAIGCFAIAALLSLVWNS